MLKKRNVILILLLVLFAGIQAVNAEYIENADYNFDTRLLTINGKFFEDSEGEYASVLVLKSGAELDSITEAKTEKQEQVKIKDGCFSLSFPLSVSSYGTYRVYVKAGNTDKKFEIIYSGSDYAYNDIMVQMTPEEYAKAVNTYNKEFILNDSVYGEVDDKLAAGKLAFSLMEFTESKQQIKEVVKTAAFLQALNENKQELVFDRLRFVCDTNFKLDTIDSDYNVTAYSLYNNSITDAGKQKVIDSIVGKNYQSIEEFQKDFIYYCTIAAIKYNKSSGTGFINSILAANNSVNQFDLTNFNSVADNSIGLLLLGGNEWNKADIQKLLNTKKTANNPTKGDLGSSGGGGSSGGTTGGVKPAGGYSQDYSAAVKNDAIVFSDITEELEWARPSIEQLAQKKILNGMGDGTFAPNNNVTRAEFIKMILAALALEDAKATCSFSDVTENDWYYPYVAAAYSNGIVNGYSDKYFGAADNITRQDAAVIITRAVAAKKMSLKENTQLIDFSDSDEIDEYAKEAVNSLVKAGILKGIDESFMPKSICTRAQAAVMINNTIAAVGAEEEVENE